MKETPGRNSMRAQFIIAAACLAHALVLQLHGDNVQPLTLEFRIAPDAVLVGSTNRFQAFISGGRPPYNCEWYCDSPDPLLTNFGYATVHELSYIAPDAPKEASIAFSVKDSKPDNPRFEQIFKGFWQVRVAFGAIAFNYDTSAHSQDALNIRQNKATAITAPEYVSGGANKPAAYIKNMAPRVCARFTVLPTAVTSLKLNLTATSSGCLGNLNATEVRFLNGVSQGDVTIGSDSYTKFTTSQMTPAKIQKDTFNWKWLVTAVNDTTIPATRFGETSGHTVYTLDAAPGAPWNTAANNQCNPWTDVLAYACDWAANCETPNSIVRSITQKAYSDFGKQYNSRLTHTLGGQCNLTALLADNWADCRDMAAVVHLFTRAIACPSVLIKRVEGGIYGFTTKPILPMKNSTWNSHVFRLHDFAWYNQSVYDACLKVNQGAPYQPLGTALSMYKTDIYSGGGWQECVAFPIESIY